MTKKDETKTDETKKEPKAPKSKRADHVFEPSENTTEHNPYDTKVGGKPPATLADGTVPETVKQTASKAE